MLSINEYFEGAVKSIGYEGPAGRATVGVMAPGSYTFQTKAPETMSVIDGKLTVKLSSSDSWVDYGPGTRFDVPADSSFELRVAEPSAYHCSFH